MALYSEFVKKTTFDPTICYLSYIVVKGFANNGFTYEVMNNGCVYKGYIIFGGTA
jgi:hypothetical protein